ncbi:hypothetical protein TRFO_20441 [Tritrichomonas foetus]|uniref:Uncharacterized protein n=1 Tax=Tritrichomonas foetus TaxID=1144522 RepID=A0A1J4KGY6_9EUKA|nr:hypothetical protein TRFO_20441 [Tritrichomonas foetus]|eukprot:OHT10314.1 hypothetical protein TRFO_20441 [Tritrichomonas foetus]
MRMYKLYSLQHFKFTLDEKMDYKKDLILMKTRFDLSQTSPNDLDDILDEDSDFMKFNFHDDSHEIISLSDFQKRIEQSAKNLNYSFENAIMEDIVSSLKLFECHTKFYDFAVINQILEKYEVYRILVDLIDIDPNGEIKKIEDIKNIPPIFIENAKISSFLMLQLSQFSHFATNYFYKFRFIDKFFQNFKLYSRISIWCGMNIIHNILIDLNPNDKLNIVNSVLIEKYMLLLENYNDFQLNDRRMRESAYNILVAFCFCISSITKFDNHLLNLSKNIINHTHAMAIKSTGLEECIPLLKAITILCQSSPQLSEFLYNNHIINLLNNNFNDSNNNFDCSFIYFLSFYNEESINVTLNLYYSLFMYSPTINDKVNISKLICWDKLSTFYSQNPSWFKFLLEFIEMMTRVYEVEQQLWNSGIYINIINSFEFLNFENRSAVCYTFFHILDMVKGSDFKLFLESGVLSIYFIFLDVDHDEIIDSIFDFLHMVNAKATAWELGTLAEEYRKNDAISILNDLAPRFTKAQKLINEIHEIL